MARSEYSWIITVSVASNRWVTRSYIGVLVLILYEVNELCEEGFEDDDDAEGWQGNRRRRLWKSTCVKAALNVKMHHLPPIQLGLYLPAQLVRPRASIICGSRTNPSNIQRPQVCMSDLGRSPMGSNKHTVRREANRGNDQTGRRLLGEWIGGTQRYVYSSGRCRRERGRRVGEGGNYCVGDIGRRQCR